MTNEHRGGGGMGVNVDVLILGRLLQQGVPHAGPTAASDLAPSRLSPLTPSFAIDPIMRSLSGLDDELVAKAAWFSPAKRVAIDRLISVKVCLWLLALDQGAGFNNRQFNGSRLRGLEQRSGQAVKDFLIATACCLAIVLACSVLALSRGTICLPVFLLSFFPDRAMRDAKMIMSINGSDFRGECVASVSVAREGGPYGSGSK